MSVEPQNAGRATATTARKHVFFEPTVLVLLSLATVGTAWCSYQAAVWGGISQRTMNLSSIAGRKAAAGELQSMQYRLVDVLLFSQYVNAHASSNETLARYYSDRFRGEAKTAFDAWLADRPFENSRSAAHPFVTNYYRPKLLEDARIASIESETLWQEAGEAGRNGRSYVLVTVLLATALFCAGIAVKFEAIWIRRAVLALGLAAFAFAIGRMLMLPVQL